LIVHRPQVFEYDGLLIHFSHEFTNKTPTITFADYAG
jgi:hypothetical protein